jgi:1,4-dihydroxy-2-naphthoate octaprenyltransferase
MSPDLKSIIGPMRPPFLILTPACVLLGAGTAFWSTGQFHIWHFILILIGAMAAHISVNALNEYADFRSGLDLRTQRTPFSGGTGTLPAAPEAAPAALTTGLVTLAIAAAVGVYFVVVRGWGILPLGLLGLAVIYFYTNLLLRIPLTSLISPGLGFGTLMVMGTHFCLTGQYTWTAFIASMTPFFLVSNLLLLNQFPDVEPDKTVKRVSYPILIGRRASSRVYAAFIILAYLSIIIGVLLKLLPVWALFGLLTVFLAVPSARGAYRYADDIPNLIPAMGQNVMINVLTPALIAVGLFIAALL